MRTINRRVATVGMMGIAGLTAAAACAPIDSSEPRTGTSSAALNTTPSVLSTATALNVVRSFGASCTLWDTNRNRDVVITAFGVKGTTPDYLNTYEVYDPTNDAWTSSASRVIRTASGTIATAAAYVGAVNHPDANTSGHLNTCIYAGGWNGSSLQNQVWKATVSNAVVTWTKLANLQAARAKFGLSWGGTSTHKLIAVGGGFDTTRTAVSKTIETYDLVNNAWATETATLDQAVHSVGFVKLSDTQFVAAGGNGATNNPSAHINAIKVNSDGTVGSVGDIKNAGATVITARKDNIAVPTGKTGLTAGVVQILVAMGQNSASPPALVAAPRTVNINFNNTPASYSADAAGAAPLDNAAFPTVVDGYVSPNDASSNPGYIVITGLNGGSSTQTPINSVQKWTPGAAGGAWTPAVTSVTLGQTRLGINAIYIKSIDKVLAAGGTNQYPLGAGQTDYLNADLIR